MTTEVEAVMKELFGDAGPSFDNNRDVIVAVCAVVVELRIDRKSATHDVIETVPPAIARQFPHEYHIVESYAPGCFPDAETCQTYAGAVNIATQWVFKITGPGYPGGYYIGQTESCGKHLVRLLDSAYNAGILNERSRGYGKVV